MCIIIDIWSCRTHSSKRKVRKWNLNKIIVSKIILLYNTELKIESKEIIHLWLYLSKKYYSKT